MRDNKCEICVNQKEHDHEMAIYRTAFVGRVTHRRL